MGCLHFLSYFIQDEYSEKASKNFKQMYGKDASFININNINEITKTLNQLLLKKELIL
jgi:AICAR transformylase/IMP cyclohydrolase PurH